MRPNTYGACAILMLLSGFAATLGCSDQQDDCSNNANCSPFDGGTAGSNGGTSGAGGSLGAGGGVGTGGAGDGGAKPCDDKCTGSKPVCNESTNTCVGCQLNSDCSGSTPVCETTSNTCVQCVEN